MEDGSSSASSGTNGTPGVRFVVHHFESPQQKFTKIPNSMLRGRFPVPLKALERVILLHMLSLDTGMTLSRRHIDHAVQEGSHAVTTALRGLEGKGYLSRVCRQRHGNSGAFEWAWTVTDDPIRHPLETPDTGSPETDAWDTGTTCDNADNPRSVPYPISPAPDGWDVLEDRSTKIDNEDFSAKNPPVVGIPPGRLNEALSEIDSDDDHVTPIRSAHIDTAHKAQFFTSVWVKLMKEEGLRPNRAWRDKVGFQLREQVDSGATDDELRQMVRQHAAQEGRIHREGGAAVQAERKRAAEFWNFWDAYPRKSDQERARAAWSHVVGSGVDPKNLTVAALRFASEHRFGANGLPYPHTWLATGQWRQYAHGRAA